MRSKLAVLALALAVGLAGSGCFTMTHTVGSGPQGRYKVERRQWFLLAGLIPLNTVDGGELAGGAKDFRITTQAGPIDVLVAILTYNLVSPRTVIVEKGQQVLKVEKGKTHIAR